MSPVSGSLPGTHAPWATPAAWSCLARGALQFRSLSRCFGRLDCPVDGGELPLKPKWLQKRPQVEPVVFRRIVLSVICSSA